MSLRLRSSRFRQAVPPPERVRPMVSEWAGVPPLREPRRGTAVASTRTCPKGGQACEAAMIPRYGPTGYTSSSSIPA